MACQGRIRSALAAALALALAVLLSGPACAHAGSLQVPGSGAGARRWMTEVAAASSQPEVPVSEDSSCVWNFKRAGAAVNASQPVATECCTQWPPSLHSSTAYGAAHNAAPRAAFPTFPDPMHLLHAPVYRHNFYCRNTPPTASSFPSTPTSCRQWRRSRRACSFKSRRACRCVHAHARAHPCRQIGRVQMIIKGGMGRRCVLPSPHGQQSVARC